MTRCRVTVEQYVDWVVGVGWVSTLRHPTQVWTRGAADALAITERQAARLYDRATSSGMMIYEIENRAGEPSQQWDGVARMAAAVPVGWVRFVKPSPDNLPSENTGE